MWEGAEVHGLSVPPCEEDPEPGLLSSAMIELQIETLLDNMTDEEQDALNREEGRCAAPAP